MHNFSSYQLSNIEKLLLCERLNFSLPLRCFKFENYLLLQFELLYQDIYDSDSKDESLLHLKSEIRMLNYHQIEFTAKKITIMKTYASKNMTPL